MVNFSPSAATKEVLRGCAHLHHSHYCVEMNATWCQTCAGSIVKHHQGLQHPDEGAVRVTMVPAQSLHRLVHDDIARLRLTLACTQQALYASTGRSGGLREDALEAEAKRSKDDVDRYLMRLVELIQETRTRLYTEIDALVALRRRQLDELSGCERDLSQLVQSVHGLLTSCQSDRNVVSSVTLLTANPAANPAAPSSLSKTVEAAEAPAPAVGDQPMDFDTKVLHAEVVCAELLSASEEHLVLHTERLIEDMFPTVANSGGPTEKGVPVPISRDRLDLANGHQCALVPFSLRLNTSWMRAEFDSLHIRDAVGRTGEGLPPPLPLPTPVNVSAVVSRSTSATSVGSVEGGTQAEVGDNHRNPRRLRAHWEGLSSAQARRRNIRTPDPLKVF